MTNENVKPNKVRLFIENFLVYGMGGIISRIIPLIMIPIITRLMPGTEYFGLNDLSNTVLSIAQALAVLGMYDAMFRLFFEKDDIAYKKSVCSTALSFTLLLSLAVFIVLLLLKKVIAKSFFGDSQYGYLVYITALAALVGATNSIVAAPTRMQNQRKIFLVRNTIAPIISYGIAIPLLIKGFYVIALPLAAVISALIMEMSFYILNRKWFDFKRFDKKILKQLLAIAVPLFPNFLIYWVFNSSDKVMITNLIGIGAAGIYAVGSKLGHCSQLIYTAFAGGWQYFAFSTMKEKNQVKSNSLIFEYLGVISFVATFFVCSLSYSIFRILFEEQYWSGYIVAPYLFLAPLLQMLFQVACNQFLVVKKTWPNMLILSCGAIINILFNLIFIPAIGIEGAAIATLCGYIISDIVCVIVLSHMKLMEIRFRFVMVCVIAIAYMVTWRFTISDNTLISTIVALFSTVLIIILYRKDLIYVFSKLLNKKISN